MVGGGLVIGLAARFVFGLPEAARVIFLDAVIALMQSGGEALERESRFVVFVNVGLLALVVVNRQVAWLR